MIPLHRLPSVARSLGGGGSGVTVNIGSIGGGLDGLTEESLGEMVGAAVTRQVRQNGGMRSLIKQTARRGL